MTHNVTCIECPLGCAIQVETENGIAVCVRGNHCPRGKVYAESEVSCPVRVVTSTVRTAQGRMVSVKTSRPIPKAKMFAVMEKINALHPSLPLCVGDVLVRGIEGDADLVVTDNAR